MIKHTDVRIGNWVNYNGKPYQMETTAREYPTLNTDKFGICIVDWNNIQPILLTEDILMKCGFEYDHKYKNKLYAPNIFLDFRIIYNTKHNRISISKSSSITLDHIIYLHQLQNLFYSLGKELEITI